MEETIAERVRNEQSKMGRLDARVVERITSSTEPMEIEENGGQKSAVPPAEAEMAERNERTERVWLVGENSSKMEELAMEDAVKWLLRW